MSPRNRKGLSDDRLQVHRVLPRINRPTGTLRIGTGCPARRGRALSRGSCSAAGGGIHGGGDGKGSNALDRRPQLRAALAACKKQRATLLIAKLDRLARNVHFITGLIESGTDFVAADMPNAN